MKTFAELFRKYRLRAEFASLTEFANALAQKGYFYDMSVYSHWQKGTKIPRKRELLLSLLEIFIERYAIKTDKEANELLESVEHGYLTDTERHKLWRNNLQVN